MLISRDWSSFAVTAGVAPLCGVLYRPASHQDRIAILQKLASLRVLHLFEQLRTENPFLRLAHLVEEAVPATLMIGIERTFPGGEWDEVEHNGVRAAPVVESDALHKTLIVRRIGSFVRDESVVRLLPHDWVDCGEEFLELIAAMLSYNLVHLAKGLARVIHVADVHALLEEVSDVTLKS